MGVALAPMMIATTLAAGAVSAAGAVKSGEANAANLNYQAQVAANNSLIAKQNMDWETQSGEIAATNQEMKTRATVGQTKADQGASGVDVNTGSFVAARAGEAEVGSLDALTIRTDAARKAYGYAVAATSDTAQSQLDKVGADNAATAGDISAGASLLGSASSAFGQYAKWGNVASPTPALT